MGLKKLLQQNEGNFSCTRIKPKNWQPNGPMLIDARQKCDWDAKSIW